MSSSVFFYFVRSLGMTHIQKHKKTIPNSLPKVLRTQVGYTVDNEYAYCNAYQVRLAAQ